MKTMKNIWYLNLAIVVYTVVPSTSSDCYYQDAQGHSFISTNSFVEVICKNVTPEVSLRYDEKYHPQSLTIENSVIPELPLNSSLSQFKTLMNLYLVNLQIEDISPRAFTGLKNLSALILAKNKLTRVRAGVFYDLDNLEELDLTKNSISVLEENCFSNLVKLTGLYISDNLLTELKKIDLPSLTYFSTYNNKLIHFDMDLSQTKVNGITLQNSHLTEIDFALFPKNLTTINLYNNQISVLKHFEQANADAVYLTRNNLTKLETYPQNVKTLDLEYNQIEFLENKLPQASQIRVLILSHNKISEIGADSFLGLNNLEHLFLDHNELTSLSKGVFVHTPELTRLKLGHNHFQNVDPNALSGLHKLNHLEISEEVFSMLNLSSLPSDLKVFLIKF